MGFGIVVLWKRESLQNQLKVALHSFILKSSPRARLVTREGNVLGTRLDEEVSALKRLLRLRQALVAS